MGTAHGRGTIQIDASVKGVDSIKTATGEYQKLQVRVGGLSGAMSQLGAKMTQSVVAGNLATMAIGTLSSALSTAVRNSLEWEDVVGKNSALVNELTSSVGHLVTGIEAAKFAQSIFGEGISLSTDHMIAAEKAAVAYARRHEVDIPTALEKVRKLILTGKGTFFAEMGLDVKLAGTASERTAQALAVLSDKFGSLKFSAENTGEATSSAMNELSDAVAELGATLLKTDTATGTVKTVTGIIGKMAEAIRDVSKATRSWGDATKFLFERLETFVDLVTGSTLRRAVGLQGPKEKSAEQRRIDAMPATPGGVSFISVRDDTGDKERDPEWLRGASKRTLAERARRNAGGRPVLDSEGGMVEGGGKSPLADFNLEDFGAQVRAAGAALAGLVQSASGDDSESRLAGVNARAGALGGSVSAMGEALAGASALSGIGPEAREELDVQMQLVDAQHQRIEALRTLIELKQIDADAASQQISALESTSRAMEAQSDVMIKLAGISHETHETLVGLGEQALGGLTQALGDSVFAALEGSESFGAAMAKMTSQVLKGIAVQSLVHAAFETAKGIAALAGVVTAPLAAGHFAAAAKFAAVALLAGTAGAALGAAAGSGNTASAGRNTGTASQSAQRNEERRSFATRKDSEPQKFIVNVYLGNYTDPAAALHTQKQIRAMAMAA